MMLRHFWSAAVVSFVVACSGGGKGNDGEPDGTVKLYLGKLQVPMFDSISITVSAPDMATIHISKKSLDDNLKIEGIPQGEDREFEVKIYADGQLVQKGEANADIKADESTTIPITLEALFGFLRLEVPLGFTNNTGINSGELFLEEMKFEMKFETGKGVFNTGALPLDIPLNLSIALYDKYGYVLFEGEEEITLYSISQTKIIPLHSTNGSAILEFTTSSEGPKQILATLPTSTSRPPKDYGDIFFTEIFVYPKTGGDPFEYMEIYNATMDILELSNCRIAEYKTTTSTSKTKYLKMPGNLTLPPMEFLFLGRDSAFKADVDYDYSVKYDDFVLGNTRQHLGFFCGDFTIDSLYYSNEASNIFPVKQGIAMQLPLENYENRTLGSSWCLGFSHGEDAVCQ